MELIDVISAVTALSSVVLFMTGWPIATGVVRRKSTGEISTFPYIAMLCNCTLWVIYGFLNDNMVLKAVNGIGLLHQLVYIMLFYYYSKSRRLFNQQLLLAFIFLASLLTYMNHEWDDQDRAPLIGRLGLLGSCLSVITYASPLSAVGDVISKKSTASMNFSLSLAYFLVGLEWAVYGKFLGDNFIFGPNVLGVIVSMLQLSLFWIYPAKTEPVLP